MFLIELPTQVLPASTPVDLTLLEVGAVSGGGTADLVVGNPPPPPPH